MFFFVPKKYQIKLTQQSSESVPNRAIEKGKDLFNLNANKIRSFLILQILMYQTQIPMYLNSLLINSESTLDKSARDFSSRIFPLFLQEINYEIDFIELNKQGYQ